MIKKLFAVISILFGLLVFQLSAAPAQAGLLDSFKQQACEGVNLGQSSDCTGGEGQLRGILRTVINILSLIVGVIAVIMLIIAGLKFVTSSGDPQSVSSARNTIIYAVVGLVIVVLAQALVRFVLARAPS